MVKLATFLGALLIATTLHSADRPNIMVFLVDDMGVMDTSVPFLTDEAGQPKRYPLNDFYRTPAMERLAGNGIRFNQFYAMSVCSPTRTSILTGQNAARHRVTNWINPREDNAGTYGATNWNWGGIKQGDVTLPCILRETGYRTIHVGKGHFAPFDHAGSDPANIGFEINVAGSAFGAPGSYYAEKNYGQLIKGRRSEFTPPHLESYHGSDTFLTEALTIEAKKQVKKSVEDDKPFFLYFAHYAVHAPFESDPRFAAHYKDSGKPKAAQAFATLVEGMDKSLGDMMDQFEKLEIAENTLIFFLGDNGSDAPLGDQHVVACAEPLRGKKGAHYEGGMRVPFIAAWGKANPENSWQKAIPIPAGKIHGQIASVSDLFPTILELSKTAVPDGHSVDGFPLQKMLSGTEDETHPSQFLMHYPHGRHRSNYFTTWRDGDWKVIYHALPDEPTTGNHIQFSGGNYELFNLKEDPFESTNLADKNPEKLKEMMKGMIASLEAKDAVYPVSAEGKSLKPQLPD
ncbi:MAG: sulfatase-like hydrolase/transferase [Verrucomicrobiales bacterium]|nr:sulfatase-like hydrolase/transferase [Verrucomicrobiales bacterium]